MCLSFEVRVLLSIPMVIFKPVVGGLLRVEVLKSKFHCFVIYSDGSDEVTSPMLLSFGNFSGIQ